MTDPIDRENLIAIIMRVNDGSLNDWLETLDQDELQYALNILSLFHAARENFINSI